MIHFRHQEAMALYLKLGDRTVFSLIRERDLFDWVPVPDLMDLDPKEAVKMFLEFREKMPPETVVMSLEEAGGNGRNLYLYLDTLWERDREASREFQGECSALSRFFSTLFSKLLATTRVK